jgi:hypothetical protein
MEERRKEREREREERKRKMVNINLSLLNVWKEGTEEKRLVHFD